MLFKFNTKKINMTKEEYTSLTPQERMKLNEKLCWMSWHDYHESHPDVPEPEMPCVINGVLIAG